jgi:lysozyme
MDAIELAVESIKRHEGFMAFAYQCPANKTSIGFGRNIQEKGITLGEAEHLLENDIAECVQDLSTRSYWGTLSSTQQAGLIDLRFNLGAKGYSSFKQMEIALDMGDYTEAAYQILHSKYHDQVGKRAEDVAKMVTTL